jgi:hypothetical protein
MRAGIITVKGVRICGTVEDLKEKDAEKIS